MKIKKEISKYLVVTPLVAAVDFGVYFLSIRFMPHSAAKALSYVVANGFGYAFNKYWIFKKKKPSSMEAGRYVIVDVVLFVSNIATNQAVLVFWPKSVFWAITVASLSTAVLSFMCKKWWVFKRSSAGKK